MNIKFLLIGLLTVILIAGCVSNEEAEYKERLEDLSKEAEDSMKDVSTSMRQDFLVDVLDCESGGDGSCDIGDVVEFILLNTGSVDIDASKTMAHVNDVEQELVCSEGPWEENKAIECSFVTSESITCDVDIVKISIESGIHQKHTISCYDVS